MELKVELTKAKAGMQVFVPATKTTEGGLAEIVKVISSANGKDFTTEVSVKGLPFNLRFDWTELVAQQVMLMALYIRGTNCIRARPKPERVAPLRADPSLPQAGWKPRLVKTG